MSLTPARTTAVVAAALTVVLSVLLGFAQQEIANVSSAARQSTEYADVYTDSSEMDSDLAQVMLLDDDPALAAQRHDAAAGFQADSSAVDADLRQTPSKSVQGLAAYRTQAAAAAAAGTRAAGLSAYEKATDLAHRTLLPAALSAEQARAGSMNAAARHERLFSTLGIVVAALLGLALLGLAGLVLLTGRRLTGRLAVAVLVAVAVAGVSITILHLGDGRLRAGHDDLAGFLTQSRAEGAAFEVAADRARHLVTVDPRWPADAAAEAGQISVTGETRIAWTTFNALSAAGTTPAGLSLYAGAAAQAFDAFRGFLLASEEKTVLAGADRLSAARSVYIVWYAVPIAAMAVILFLAGRLDRRPRFAPLP